MFYPLIIISIINDNIFTLALMPVLHTVLVLIQTFALLYQTFYFFVCLSYGLAYHSTAMVMSGHCLYFVGLVPKLGCHDIQNVLQI